MVLFCIQKKEPNSFKKKQKNKLLYSLKISEQPAAITVQAVT